MTTSRAGTELGETVWDLPPLILHPFADRNSSERLLEHSRNALISCGLGGNPGDGMEREDLERRLLEGRYSEIRMLFFLGKDLVRWTGQCQEFAERLPELSHGGVREQSFATLLTAHMPEAVSLKLQGWGVHDAGVIFARAIGLNHIFGSPPEMQQLAEGFVRSYHRYGDGLYNAWLQSSAFREITPANFRFELYASGEYTKMLETEWGAT